MLFRSLDPIPRYRNYLRATDVWTQRLEDRVASRAQRLRTELRDATVGAADFDVDEVFASVFSDVTPELQQQRRALRAELARER